MSRNKKSRKQGKLTTLLPTGPSKREKLADPESRESKRKAALAKSRRAQAGAKQRAANAAEAKLAQNGENKSNRVPRLKRDPAAVAMESAQLLDKADEEQADSAE